MTALPLGHRDRVCFVLTYVEEHPKKVTGADGETRTATRCRPGNRSHESEVHVDKESKRTERERRHTAGDDNIERFKREASDKHSNQPALKLGSVDARPSPTAIAAPSGGSADAGGSRK
jgi:hypothetical protein